MTDPVATPNSQSQALTQSAKAATSNLPTVGEPIEIKSISSQPAVAATYWTKTIILAGIISWLTYTFPPITWRIPDSMSHINAMSPQSELDKLKAVEIANLWKNSLMKFSLAGVSAGLVGFWAMAFGARVAIATAIGTVICGLISGALSGAIGLQVWQHLNLEYPIPLISEASRPLFCDGVVFAVTSILLSIPLAFFIWRQAPNPRKPHASSPLLAGVLAGFAVPICIAVVSQNTNTGVFPPLDLLVTIIWFAILTLLTWIMVVTLQKSKLISSINA